MPRASYGAQRWRMGLTVVGFEIAVADRDRLMANCRADGQSVSEYIRGLISDDLELQAQQPLQSTSRRSEQPRARHRRPKAT